jgi:hypothetical protein
MAELIVEDYLKPGTRVEVRSRFDGHWSRGFEVVQVLNGAYKLRRLSDGSLLPVDFDAEDVRHEKRRQGLWWA